MPNPLDPTRRPRPFAPPPPAVAPPGVPAHAPSRALEGGSRRPPFVGTRLRTTATPQSEAAPALALRPPAAATPQAVHPSTPAARAPQPAGEQSPPPESEKALSGLPYIDSSGAAHDPGDPTPSSRPSEGRHHVEHDVPSILEAVAGRIRAGGLTVPHADPAAGDAAVLAAVLAAMLRHRPG